LPAHFNFACSNGSKKLELIHFPFPVRIGVLLCGISFLHWIGADSLPAIGALGWQFRTGRESSTTKKARLPRKDPSSREKKS